MSTTDALHRRVDRDFTYHAPDAAAIEAMRVLRRQARDLAHAIVDLVPPSRERSTSITHLEEVVMWANAGIAREGADVDDLDDWPEPRPTVDVTSPLL